MADTRAGSGKIQGELASRLSHGAKKVRKSIINDGDTAKTQQPALKGLSKSGAI